jgi:hypothetical protein
MVIFSFLILLAFFGYAVWRFSPRTEAQGRGWPQVWRLARVIAALRIGALWLGIAGLENSGWLQIPAYFMLMAGWPDVYIVRAARAHTLRWGILTSMVLAATSLPWSAAFLWFARRLRKEPGHVSES